MGTALRTAFSSDRGTTRWLATAASGALLMAMAAALPALADEPSSGQQEGVSQDVEPEVEAILGEPVEDEIVESVLEQSGSGYEGVIGEPVEDGVPAGG